MDKREELGEIESEIRIIEQLVESLTEAKQTLIRLRYLEENKDRYVWRVLVRQGIKVKSERSYYNLKDSAVEDLAKAFGYAEKRENEESAQ